MPQPILSSLSIAAQVIARAGRRTPADAALRTVLRESRGIAREDAREISRAVFAYDRWRGWLDLRQPVTRQLQQARGLADLFERQPASFPAADLRARSVPAWLAEQMDLPEPWLRTLQAEPLVWLRAKPGTASALAQTLGDCRESGLADALAYHGPEDLFRRSEFQAGAFELQDIASQAVGWLCHPQPGQAWWDACAGEGGKTLHLSALMQNRGLIWATDRAAWRLQRLKLRAARAQCFNYRSALWDGGSRPPFRTRFDGVLLDAPCSGVGTWQRNPHARWTTTPEDVRELAGLQQRLLERVAGSVKAGGRLVYAICTLTRAETIDVAADFERAHPDFVPLELSNPLRPGDAPASRLWLWPQDTGGNAMFVATWQRQARAGA